MRSAVSGNARAPPSAGLECYRTDDAHEEPRDQEARRDPEGPERDDEFGRVGPRGRPAEIPYAAEGPADEQGASESESK